MASEEVKVEYEQLSSICGNAGEQQQNTQQLLQRINAQLETLKGGAWVGENANAFYQEMEGEVIPGLQRLVDSLGEMEEATNRTITIFQAAEEEASGVFPKS